MNENDKQAVVRWYFKPVWIFIAILAIGPLALPLIWLSPALKRWHKIVVSIALVVITVWLLKATVDIYQNLLDQLSGLQ